MFNDELRIRTYKFSKEVLLTLRKIPENLESRIILNQLIKSSTSVAANFRSACNCRSKNEWFAKLCIVAEETDESIYWIDLIIDLYNDKETEKFKELRDEASELVKIFTKVKNNSSTRQK